MVLYVICSRYKLNTCTKWNDLLIIWYRHFHPVDCSVLPLSKLLAVTCEVSMLARQEFEHPEPLQDEVHANRGYWGGTSRPVSRLSPHVMDWSAPRLSV